MTLTDAGVVFGMIASLSGGVATGAKFYADHTYVLVSDSLRGQLYEKEEQIFRLEQREHLTDDEREYLEFLYLQKRRIQLELE